MTWVLWKIQSIVKFLIACSCYLCRQPFRPKTTWVLGKILSNLFCHLALRFFHFIEKWENLVFDKLTFLNPFFLGKPLVLGLWWWSLVWRLLLPWHGCWLVFFCRNTQKGPFSQREQKSLDLSPPKAVKDQRLFWSVAFFPPRGAEVRCPRINATFL